MASKNNTSILEPHTTIILLPVLVDVACTAHLHGNDMKPLTISQFYTDSKPHIFKITSCWHNFPMASLGRIGYYNLSILLGMPEHPAVMTPLPQKTKKSLHTPCRRGGKRENDNSRKAFLGNISTWWNSWMLDAETIMLQDPNVIHTDEEWNSMAEQAEQG